MKLVAHSEVPKALPYTHLGYLAAPGPQMGKVGLILGFSLAVFVGIVAVLKWFSGR